MLDRMIDGVLRRARLLHRRTGALLELAENVRDEMRAEVLYVGAITENRCMREGCGVPNGYPFCWECSSEMLARRAN